jgi:neutral trehalase
LAGAALLGFVFSNTLLRGKVLSLGAKKSAAENSLREQEAKLVQLESANEAKLQAVENLQKLSQEVENQVFEKDKELLMLRMENVRLKEEVQQLTDNPIEKIKEIDVIREVPVLVFKEVSIPETRKDKAKKLMKAFKKGFLDEHEELKVSEETIE